MSHQAIRLLVAIVALSLAACAQQRTSVFQSIERLISPQSQPTETAQAAVSKPPSQATAEPEPPRVQF